MMMEVERGFSGYKDEGYSAISVLYGNGAYSMIIILPDEGENVDDCMRNIDPEYISRLAKDDFGFITNRLRLRMPKFEIVNELDMISALQSMELKKMFSPENAEFREICESRGIFISRILQGTRIVIDEKGTEAITYTEEKGKWYGEPGPLAATDFFVDRPFAFIIAEKSTGLPLFMGRINKL